MTDLEFRILTEFKRKRVTSLSYLMSKYKMSIDSAQDMIDWLASYSRKDEYSNGRINRVFL